MTQNMVLSRRIVFLGVSYFVAILAAIIPLLPGHRPFLDLILGTYTKLLLNAWILLALLILCSYSRRGLWVLLGIPVAFWWAIALPLNLFPEVSATHKPVLKCIYRLLISEPIIKSIRAYVVDDYRSAIDYSFNASDGHDLTANVVIFGPIRADGSHFYAGVSYSGSPQNGVPEEPFALERKLDLACHLEAVGDYEFPLAPDREHWRRIDPLN